MPPTPRYPYSLLVASGGLGQRRLRLCDDGAKRGFFVHRDVGENLAVELDARELEPVHELRIGQAFGADAGVDALDPQAPEGPLLHLAVAIGVLAGRFDRLPRDADGVLATTPVALGLFQDVLVLGAGGYTAFDACHCILAPQLRPYGAQAFTVAVSAFDRTLVPRFWRIYLLLWLMRRCRLPATPCLSIPLAVSLKRILTPLLVLSLGILVLSVGDAQTAAAALDGRAV